jgi:hypothetical protein
MKICIPLVPPNSFPAGLSKARHPAPTNDDARDGQKADSDGKVARWLIDWLHYLDGRSRRRRGHDA